MIKEQDVQKIKSVIYSCKNVENHLTVQNWLENIQHQFRRNDKNLENLIELNKALLDEKTEAAEV